jgi:Ca2+-binding RTX toxin-like protein
MTAQQQTDAYQFFIVAFGAAPGTVYMDQLNEAYDFGLTTKEIVNIYTTKDAFTARYPNFLTTQDFAISLVNNVVGNSADAAAKAEAVADITAALNSGFSRGDVIFQVFTNLANKDRADPTWGNTAKQFDNQVAIAKFVTQELLVDSTDTATLRGFLNGVTQDVVTVQAAKDAILFVNGETFSLTAGVDSGTAFAGGTGNDSYTATAASKLNSLDTFDGGAGTNRLSILDVDGGSAFLSDSQFSGVRNVQILDTTTAIVNLGAAASAAGITTLNLLDNESLGKSIKLIGFNGDLAINGASNTEGDTMFVSLADTGIKTVNLGGGQDLVNVDSGGGATATVSFVSGSVGNGTANNVTIAGDNGTIVLDDEGVDVDSVSDGTFNVLATDALGAVQDRGFFGRVILGDATSETLDLLTGDNNYINLGNGNDNLTMKAGTGTTQFIEMGNGDDTVNISGSGNGSTQFIEMGNGDDTVNISGSGVQNIQFTSGNNIAVFTDTTFEVNDTVVGGTGADTLRISSSDAGIVSGNSANENGNATNSGIEVLELSSGFSDSIVLANVSASLNTLTLKGGLGDGSGVATFTNGGVLNLAVGGNNENVTLIVAGTGLSDGVTINNTIAADGSGFTVDMDINDVTAEGIETLTINTTAAGNAVDDGNSIEQTFANITLTGTGLARTTVAFVGSGAVSTGTILASSVDASGLTDGAYLDGTTAAAVDTFTGSDGDDNIYALNGDITANLGAGDDFIAMGEDDYGSGVVGIVNLNGGAGDDEFSLGTTLTSADLIDGGEGRDELTVWTGLSYADGIFNQITNVEIFSFYEKASGNSAAVTSSLVLNAIAQSRAIDTVDFYGIDGDTNNLTVAEGFDKALTVSFSSDSTFDNIIVNSGSTTDLTVNTFSSNLEGTTTGSATVGDDTFTGAAGRANVLNINVWDDGDVAIVDSKITNFQTVNIVDEFDYLSNIELIVSGNQVATVDGSTVSGDLTIDVTAQIIAMTVKTGSGDDTILGSTAAMNNIDAGAGNDQVTGGNVVDTINGGAGNDLILGGLRADLLTGGLGADAFFYTALAQSSGANVDRIADFVGGVAVDGTNSGDRILIDQIFETAVVFYAAPVFAGNFGTFGSAQGALTEADGILEYVFQQDTSTLWIDINDDGALNGNDYQIILTGVTGIVDGDVIYPQLT